MEMQASMQQVRGTTLSKLHWNAILTVQTSILGDHALFRKSWTKHILELENAMIGMAKRDLMEMAYQLAETNGLRHPFKNEKKGVSVHWYMNFMKRYPEVSLRQAEAT